MKLRPYQTAALAKAEHAFEHDKLLRILWAQATGLGKTVEFSELARRRAGRTLVLAHRDELVRQAQHKLEEITGRSVGIVKAEQNELSRDIIVASVQTVSREKRLQPLKEIKWKTVVVDEAHHAEADTYQRVLKAVGSFDRTPTLGVTATPYRADNKPMGKTWQKIVHSMTIKQGVKEGYLSKLSAVTVRLNADFKKLRKVKGEIRDDDAEKLLMEARAPLHIAQAIDELAVGRPTLVFTPTVKVAYEVAKACIRKQLTAEVVTGETVLDIRRDALRRLHIGLTHVITNCAVLVEGYDEERIGCIVMARPTLSQTFYIQCIGRGTRLHPEKEDCLIIDVVGSTHRHDLCRAPVLMTEIVGEDRFVPEYEVREQGLKLVEEHPEIPGAPLHVEKVDLFAERPFAWVKTNFGYVIDLGQFDGAVYMAESDKGWAVFRNDEGTISRVYDGESFGYAQGMAEDYIRELGCDALARKSAPWRRLPMSIGQAHTMEKFGVPYNSDTWTKGDASDAIAKVFAEMHWRRANLALPPAWRA